MVKNILKELIIVLLLTLVVILVLGVVLYEYVPANKIVPEKVSYITPENVKEELQEDPEIDDTQVIITYQIDATDLNNYQKIQEYVPGKKNPFESVSTEPEEGNNEGNTSNGNNNSSGNTGNAGNSSNTNDDGYLPNKGTK